MNLEAIIFDLDGVITDTAEYHYIAWKAIATELGFELTVKHNEKLKGLSRMDSLKMIFEFGDLPLKSTEDMVALTDKKNAHYNSFLTHMTRNDTLPGVDAFLAECKDADISIAIGSASRNTKTILKQLELDTFFNTVVDGHMVENSKPDPEVFEKAAERMTVQPAKTVVFEDSIAGIYAANQGGFYSVGVGNEQVLHHAKSVIPGFQNFTLNDLQTLIN